jgi:hypothetical protein
VKTILLRIVAVFAASGLGVIGAGAIAGVPLWKAVLMAGIGGVAHVVEGLARAYMDDGQLSKDEINNVFTKVDKKARTAPGKANGAPEGAPTRSGGRLFRQ